MKKIYTHSNIHTCIYLYRYLYLFIYAGGIERRCRLRKEKFSPSGEEVKETFCRGAIKLSFERRKGFCQVDEDGTFIPGTEWYVQ